MAVEQNIQITINKAKQGNEDALKWLYNSYNKAMYNICLRMLNNKDDAADLLQDCFIIAFKNLHQLKDEKQFGGWLKRIVINECIRHCKKRLNYNEWNEGYNEIILEDEKHWWQDISIQRLNYCIHNLPDGCKQIFSLYAIEDLSHKEIASLLNISESTSKSQYHRAKKLLREHILNLK
ncbi:MAG: RNA polymerase sigma factor [Chitinophagaceae bacterium]